MSAAMDFLLPYSDSTMPLTISRRRATSGLGGVLRGDIVQPKRTSVMRQPKRCWGGVHSTRSSGGGTVAVRTRT